MVAHIQTPVNTQVLVCFFFLHTSNLIKKQYKSPVMFFFTAAQQEKTKRRVWLNLDNWIIILLLHKQSELCTFEIDLLIISINNLGSYWEKLLVSSDWWDIPWLMKIWRQKWPECIQDFKIWPVLFLICSNMNVLQSQGVKMNRATSHILQTRHSLCLIPTRSCERITCGGAARVPNSLSLRFSSN